MKAEDIQLLFNIADESFRANEKLIDSFLLDWLGCLIVGLNSCKIKPLSSSLTLGQNIFKKQKVANTDLALLLGFASHCLELDDSEFIGETHPSGVLFSALLSEANEKFLMRDLFIAASVGYLSLISLGKLFNPSHYDSGWHATGTVGSLATSLALSYLKGFTNDEASISLGVTTNLFSGVQQCFGTEVKFLAAGRAAQNAVLASRLVQNGIEGKSITYDGDIGLIKIFNANKGVIIEPEIIDFTFVKAKQYPVCHCLDPIIINLDNFFKTENICYKDVESVTITVSDYSRNILRFDDPGNIEEAQFSIPWALGVLASSSFDRTEFCNKNINKEFPLVRNIQVSVDEKMFAMDHKIAVKCFGESSIKKIFSFDRLYGKQDRSFVPDKAKNLMCPFMRGDDKLSLFNKLQSGVSDYTVGEFKELLCDNIILPKFLN